MDKDALIVEIGRLLVADAKVSAKPWDAYSLVAWFGDGVRKLNGFRYVGSAPGEPATPSNAGVEAAIAALRAATAVDGTVPWRACVVKLDRGSGKATVDFAYDNTDLWQVTPATAADIAERARP